MQSELECVQRELPLSGLAQGKLHFPILIPYFLIGTIFLHKCRPTRTGRKNIRRGSVWDARELQEAEFRSRED